jgi:two-component sensor histidine kinase
MAMVHEMLYGSGDLTEIDLSEYCSKLLDLLRDTYGIAGNVATDVDCDPLRCDLEKAIPFGLLLSELVTNAFKHALRPGSAGSVRITLKAEGESARLCVSDDGPGLSSGFDPGLSRGLGLQLATALAGQLGGKLTWENDGGARFCVAFPLGTSCGRDTV